MNDVLFYMLVTVLWCGAFVRLYFAYEIAMSNRFSLLGRGECIDVIHRVLRAQKINRGLIVANPTRAIETQFFTIGDKQTVYWDIPLHHTAGDMKKVESVLVSLNLKILQRDIDGKETILIELPSDISGERALNYILGIIFGSPTGFCVAWT